MAFTAGEITNISNSALDYYLNRGGLFDQTMQAKPLIRMLEGKKKTFPGGKGAISLAVKFAYGAAGTNDFLKGYTHNDTVTFFTPANVLRANFPWRETHLGLTLTHTELKIDGISVVDTNGEKTTEHSNRELTVLVNLFEDKLAELGEQYARSLNKMLWFNQAAGAGPYPNDPLGFLGLTNYVAEDPSIGTVGGFDRSLAVNAPWRNRARTTAFGAKVTGTPALAAHGGGPITVNTADGGALLQVLQAEHRQLIRFGGNPTSFLAGSDFIGGMERELRANGAYTQTGFSGGKDVSIGSIQWGSTTVEYDPTLDDQGKSKFGYWWDPKAIYLMAMEDEWRKEHSPARPYDKFVMYRSITSTGQLCTQQNNSSLVIEIA